MIFEKHIQPEIDIFILKYKELCNYGETRERLECFLLHTRTIYDFLSKKDREFKDAIAIDFIGKNIKLKSFPIKKDRLDQQLAHISYERLSSKQTNLFDLKDSLYKSIINGLREFNKKSVSKFIIH